MLRAAILANIFLTWCDGLDILLLGDSIDRYAVQEWCDSVNQKELDWGDRSLKYGGHYGVLHSPSYCVEEQTENRVAAVHLYGSRANGPYFTSSHEISSPIIGQIRNTSYRIRTSLYSYKSQFGKYPDYIYLSTICWDAAAPNFTVEEFAETYPSRIEEIKSIVGNTTMVASRTSVSRFFEKGNLINKMNDILRNISITSKMTLYDYDRDVWSTVNFEKTLDNQMLLFRRGASDNHPNRHYGAIAVRKMLGLQYSQYYHHLGDTTIEVKDKPHLHQKLIYHFMKSVSTNDTSFLFQRNGQQWRFTNVDVTILPFLHFGQGDIMLVTDEVLKAIPIEGKMPPLFNGHRKGCVTSSNITFIIFESNFTARCEVEEEFQFLLSNCSPGPCPVLRDLPPLIYHLIGSDHIVPHIFSNGTLVRKYNAKNIFVIENRKKRPFKGPKEFHSHGYQFENVIALDQQLYLDQFPTGDLVQ